MQLSTCVGDELLSSSVWIMKLCCVVIVVGVLLLWGCMPFFSQVYIMMAADVFFSSYCTMTWW
jgi:hypothetical protein